MQDNVTLVEGHVLELHNASYNTSGMYRCEVMVRYLTELRKQKFVQINVQGEPVQQFFAFFVNQYTYKESKTWNHLLCINKHTS